MDKARHGDQGCDEDADSSGEAEFDPPFDIIEPDALTTCLVLSSPHSGQVYPRRFLASTRLDAIALRRSEDAFVDELVIGAVAAGMPLLRARFPRAYLDPNREPYELDPKMFEGRLPPYVNSRSLRVAGGLGTIARVVGESQEIYAKRLTVEEGIRRIDCLYKPYHAALRRLLDRAVQRFGRTLLVDCHSMPSCQTLLQSGSSPRDSRFKADFVIGDRYGTSCARALADLAHEVLGGLGYAVERNKPYAGGFITEHYGHPASGRHALQIEVNRALYMDERAIAPNSQFPLVAEHLASVLRRLAGLMGDLVTSGRIAAE
jgi:N-formylglutamate amidohydrolase